VRLIFIGDVVGRAGREAVSRELPPLRERYRPDLVAINGENAAHGFGITEEIFLGLLAAGADG
jgi:calcineurin-like phosphoesterase